MKNLWELFFVFMRIGAFTFGGGYAMLPLIEKEVVDNKGWATEEEIMNYFAVGQCTPGIIAVNTATFIGYQQSGVLGGIFATFGLVTPSFIIITLIAAFIAKFADFALVKAAFAGIRVCVCVLILNAVLKLWKTAVVDKKTLVIFAAVLAISLFLPISTIVPIVAAALAGILLNQKEGKA